MNQRALLSSLLALLAAASAAAQSEEDQFNQQQAKALNAFAEKAYKKGFPRIAKVAWMQTIKLYDDQNKDAWTGLHYVKSGGSWNPDSKNPYPTEDTGSGSDGKPLLSQLEALKKELAGRHRAMAQKYAKADSIDRAQYHWGMVLRWVNQDEEAEKALKHHTFEGVSGTDLEQTLYERSKKIEKEVEEQSRTDYEVKTVTGVACGPADRAQVPYVTVQSEHFVLHGDKEEEENLHEALKWAERTLRICGVAFPWGVPDGKWPSEWAFFTAKETYQQILKANQVPDLEWKLEHTSTSGIGNTVVAATSGKQVLLDACVRNVARPCSGLSSDGYSEGIGHTFVGMIFQNNRLFSVDLKKQQGTTASEEDREYQSPDFEVWKNIALETAWKSTGGIKANELPFCDAASFSNEERIKAWSFCDYMVRRDPEMLRTMDRLANEMKGRKNPTEFEEKFASAHAGTTIPQLDKEWADFWTEASPALKAIRNNTPPLTAISKGVDKWLALLNEQRAEFKRSPVIWSVTLSTRCKEHAEYLKNNKDQRGPAAEHTEKVDLGGSYNGSLFARMAIVQVGANTGKAKKIFEEWLYKPGYRDFFINHTIIAVGMYLDGDILVINATSGIGTPTDKSSGADCYPPRNDTGLIFDREVKVEDLGPEAEKLLAENNRAGNKSIGFPLTLHFGSTGGISARGSLKCSVTGPKGDAIEGVLVFDGGEIRTTTAPGMATFWPLDPLPKGKIGFSWSWMAGQNQQVLQGAFTAK